MGLDARVERGRCMGTCDPGNQGGRSLKQRGGPGEVAIEKGRKGVAWSELPLSRNSEVWGNKWCGKRMIMLNFPV